MAGKRTPRITVKAVENALTKTRGNMAATAATLQCSRETIRRMCLDHPELAAARDEAKETVDDWVESRMLKKIDDGDTTMMIFYAKTRMKNRGYVERQEVTGADGGAIKMETSVKSIIEKVYGGNDGD